MLSKARKLASISVGALFGGGTWMGVSFLGVFLLEEYLLRFFF